MNKAKTIYNFTEYMSDTFKKEITEKLITKELQIAYSETSGFYIVDKNLKTIGKITREQADEFQKLTNIIYQENEVINKPLSEYTSEELIYEISCRKDICIVGNYYTKEHVGDTMEYLGIKPTKKKLCAFFDKYGGISQIGTELARDDLDFAINDMFDK